MTEKREALTPALQAAYRAGWDASGEGYNSEYNNQNPEADAVWVKNRDNALREVLAQSEPWCMKMNDCKTKCEDCPDEPPLLVQEPTDKQIDDAIDAWFNYVGKSWGERMRAAFAAAQGIKEKNNE